MKRLMYVVVALLLLGAKPPQKIEIAGTPLAPQNREALEQSLRRNLPVGFDVRVIVVDREVGTNQKAEIRKQK